MAVPPPPPPLSARLRQLCDDLIDHLVPGPAMAMAEQIRAKLAAPLTITVAGGVSSGKSTLVNALLGQRIAAVDAGECTRVVSEFRYGTHERVEVVGVDGGVTTLPLNRGRMPDHLGMPVERVRHVVVHLSNALLNHISVVDTPGLNTVTEVNEEATANFLGVSGREGEQTADAVSKADALVFLLPLLRQADAAVLRGFAKLFGDSSLSAANAIAVLSKVDRLAKGEDPLAAAAPIADRIAGELRGVVSAVLPVVGLLAESAEAAVFTEADARALAAVAAVDDPLDREDMLLTADDFLTFDLLDLDEPARRRLLSLLDLYGLRVAVAAADQGAHTASDFLRVFGEASGFRALRDVIVRRFAGQSEAFKAHAALNDLRRASYLRNDPDNVRALRALRSPLEKLEFDPAFVRLRLLEVAQAVSRGDLRLPDELMGDVLALADAGDPRSVVGSSAFAGRDAAAAGAARWSAWGNDSRRSPNESRMARMVKEAFESMWLEFERGAR
ncbi:MAG: dynamin family protein [Acidimicrobiaceae bacterium]|nr:dynamin family protein [Ilumatobacter sp.]MCB9381018.1 dynamin family protein [Acidimicrobiaceae bacterium]MCO5330780.1 dynamin family protein [Ilumatobacteraceae bacterium]